jgi:hypothetical protein
MNSDISDGASRMISSFLSGHALFHRTRRLSLDVRVKLFIDLVANSIGVQEGSESCDQAGHDISSVRGGGTPIACLEVHSRVSSIACQ